MVRHSFAVLDYNLIEFDQFDSLNGSENVDDAKLDDEAGFQFDEEDFEDTFITTKKTPGLQANLRL